MLLLKGKTDFQMFFLSSSPPPLSYMSTVIFSLSCSLLCYYYATESLQARFFIHTSSYDLIHFPEQTFITVLCAEAKVTVKKGMLR